MAALEQAGRHKDQEWLAQGTSNRILSFKLYQVIHFRSLRHYQTSSECGSHFCPPSIKTSQASNAAAKYDRDGKRNKKNRQANELLADFTILVPMDRRHDAPLPRGTANPRAPQIERDPEDDD